MGVDGAEDGEGDHDVDRALVLRKEVDQRLGRLGEEGNINSTILNTVDFLTHERTMKTVC